MGCDDQMAPMMRHLRDQRLKGEQRGPDNQWIPLRADTYVRTSARTDSISARCITDYDPFQQENDRE